MNPRNYTSSVPVERSVAHIERLLVLAGAKHIQKSYAEKELDAITFSLPGPNGRDLPVRLPANWRQIENILLARLKRPTDSSEQKARDQAKRCAWKLLHEWVHIQITMMEMGQAEPLEVFMSYVFDGSQTFYQMMKGQDFKALPYGGQSGA